MIQCARCGAVTFDRTPNLPRSLVKPSAVEGRKFSAISPNEGETVRDKRECETVIIVINFRFLQPLNFGPSWKGRWRGVVWSGLT